MFLGKDASVQGIKPLYGGFIIFRGSRGYFQADFSFLLEYALLAQEAGAERLRFAETVGVMEPFNTRRVISMLVEKLTIPVEFHGHNDFGLATANSMAAFAAGAEYISTTVGGLGERAGNTCLEDMVMLFKACVSPRNGEFRPGILKILSKYVAEAANRPSVTYRLYPATLLSGPERAKNTV